VIAARKPRRVISHLAVGQLEYLEAEILLAPLLDGNAQVTMVLGVATFSAGIQSSNDCVEKRACERT
jgi:hypothetical protein